MSLTVRLTLRELIKAQATQVIGAGRYEPKERPTDRSGTRPRKLTTSAGEVRLPISKLRKSSFFPSILAPRRRVDQALYAVVMEGYVHGVSTRAVDDLVVAMGCGRFGSACRTATDWVYAAGVKRQMQRMDPAFTKKSLRYTTF